MMTSYSSAGFPLIRLNGKRPLAKAWPSAPVLSESETEALCQEHPGNLGAVIPPDHLVIDVDPRRFPTGDKPLVRLCQEARVSKEAIWDMAAIVTTGSGGLHIYLKLPPGTAVRHHLMEYPGIEFKTQGSYVVTAGSIHPETHKAYVRNERSRAFNDLQTAPESLLDLIRKKDKDGPKGVEALPVGFSDDNPTVLSAYREFLNVIQPALEGQCGDEQTYKAACRGRDLGLSGEVVYQIMLEEYNPRCEPPWESSELLVKVDNAFKYAVQPAGHATAAAQFGDTEDADHPPADPKFRGWDVDKKGHKLKTLNNAVNFFLLPDYGLKETIGYDEFRGCVMVNKPLPWRELQGDADQWNDNDTVELRYLLSRTWRFDVGAKVLDEAVLCYARARAYHPLQDYLKSLVWDGTPRVEHWLANHAGARNDPYTREVSKIWLQQAVARGMEPGCKADYLIVLEGKQGVCKSQLIQMLAHPWYADIFLDPHNKDTVDAMRGRWMIEISEMEYMRRGVEAHAVKGFLSRQVDSVRLAYGKRTLDLKRSCIFIGTLNPEGINQYLGDATGNRRFLPVSVKDIDLEKIAGIKDQLFAEAVDLWKKRSKAWITDEVTKEIATEEQELRQVYDPWEYSIASYIEREDWPDVVSTRDVWLYGMQGSDTQLTAGTNRRIAAILLQLGYEHSTLVVGGRRIRAFKLGVNRAKT